VEQLVLCDKADERPLVHSHAAEGIQFQRDRFQLRLVEPRGVGFHFHALRAGYRAHVEHDMPVRACLDDLLYLRFGREQRHDAVRVYRITHVHAAYFYCGNRRGVCDR